MYLTLLFIILSIVCAVAGSSSSWSMISRDTDRHGDASSDVSPDPYYEDVLFDQD